ncbi:MAG: serine/threonine protein kinase [Deltaproteobacteria bacterium]|nr:serine/threonine protein kinase [Deltaproteobacteria bacterium]
MDTKAAVVVSIENLLEELQAILEFLYEENKAGNRLRLSDVSGQLGRDLSLEFADYFKFLKRYNYVVINRRDHALTATGEGRKIARDGPSAEFGQEVQKFFAKNIAEGGLVVEDSASEPEPGEVPEKRAKRAKRENVEKVEKVEKVERAEEREKKPEANRQVSVPAAKGAEGTKLDGHYTRYDILGSGGIGTVYRGRLNSLTLDVAIKEIKELFSFFNFLQRSEVMRHFREVVGRMALLSHPLIVRILDQNTEVAHPYFVMEYLPQGNLRTRMDKGPMDIDQVIVLFVQMCYGLRAAHNEEVVHGNLKPENVLFDALGNIRLGDFSMTRLLESDSKKVVPRVVTGSLGYLSPEQMHHGGVVTPATDTYTLGIMLYEMLTGKVPGRRSRLPSEVRQDVPKVFDGLFDQMTRDDPAERFSDMDALLDGFYKAFKDGPYLSKGRLVLFTDPVPTPDLESDESADGKGEADEAPS